MECNEKRLQLFLEQRSELEREMEDLRKEIGFRKTQSDHLTSIINLERGGAPEQGSSLVPTPGAVKPEIKDPTELRRDCRPTPGLTSVNYAPVSGTATARALEVTKPNKKQRTRVNASYDHEAWLEKFQDAFTNPGGKKQWTINDLRIMVVKAGLVSHTSSTKAMDYQIRRTLKRLPGLRRLGSCANTTYAI